MTVELCRIVGSIYCPYLSPGGEMGCIISTEYGNGLQTAHGVAGSATRLAASLLLVSGRDGSVLQSLMVPDSAESYYSPVVYRQRGSVDVILFGTGGETHRGALWTLPLTDLYAGDIGQVLLNTL